MVAMRTRLPDLHVMILGIDSLLPIRPVPKECLSCKGESLDIISLPFPLAEPTVSTRDYTPS